MPTNIIVVFVFLERGGELMIRRQGTFKTTVKMGVVFKFIVVELNPGGVSTVKLKAPAQKFRVWILSPEPPPC